MHRYAPSCKLASALLAVSWVVKPSLVTAKPLSNRSTALPFSVHDTDETGGLAQISHLRTSMAPSSTATSSEPESVGGSDKDNHRENMDNV